MTQADKNTLCGLLLQYYFEELRPLQDTATGDRDFEKLHKLNKLKQSIDTVLETVENGVVVE